MQYPPSAPRGRKPQLTRPGRAYVLASSPPVSRATRPGAAQYGGVGKLCLCLGRDLQEQEVS
jgi:hypothetical protein